MAQSLRDKSVLITGGARGIGLCTAREFARAGCRVIITDLDAQALETAKTELTPLTKNVETHVVDVSDRKAVEALAANLLEKYEGLDVLINNAGIGYQGDLATTTIETWQKLLAVDFLGPLYHIYAFLPSMMERGSGHIVNVSSGQAFFRLPSWGAYAAIKLALGGLSEILHFELRDHQIDVTTVYPFMVNTGFYENVAPNTVAGKLSMRLLPYYSNSPETVGKLIFAAVRKKKRVEMVNVINQVGYFARLVPPLADVISTVSAWLLSESKDTGHAETTSPPRNAAPSPARRVPPESTDHREPDRCC